MALEFCLVEMALGALGARYFVNFRLSSLIMVFIGSLSVGERFAWWGLMVEDRGMHALDKI